MAEQYVVKSRTGTTEEGKAVYGRVAFEGNEYDAQRFVEQWYPRPHVEPGAYYSEGGVQPDVILVAPDGSEHAYHADPQIGWTQRSSSVAKRAPKAP